MTHKEKLEQKEISEIEMEIHPGKSKRHLPKT